jgi:hypothetical protein
MKAPQIIMIVLMSVSIGIAIAKNGEPADNYDAIKTITSALIECTILWWGGFFGQEKK